MNTTKDTKGIKYSPKKLVIIILLIALPIFIISLVGYSITRNANRFTFSNTEDKEYVYQGDITSKRKFEKHLDFNIKLLSISSNKEFEFYRYEFETSYKPTDEFKNAKFTFEFILSGNWSKDQTQSSQKSVSDKLNDPNKFTMNYEFETPDRKWLVLTVGKPSLYVKITVESSLSVGGLPSVKEEEILYYKLNINKLKPDYIIS